MNEYDFITNDFNNAFINFSKVLLDNFLYSDLYLYNENLKTVKIDVVKNKTAKHASRKDLGHYNIFNNEITVNCEKLEVVYHELFHMASTFYDGDTNYSGFMQTKEKRMFGFGLNEGYTQLLATRYFDNLEGAYPLEVKLVSNLEKICDEDIMKSLYMHADLQGLIDELCNYASEPDILEFISTLDHISNYFRTKFKFSKKRSFLKKIDKANEFLIKTYMNKLIQMYENNNITQDDLLNNFSQYLSNLPSHFEFNGKKYDVIPTEAIKKTLNSVFDIENVEILSASSKTKIVIEPKKLVLK